MSDQQPPTPPAGGPPAGAPPPQPPAGTPVPPATVAPPAGAFPGAPGAAPPGYPPSAYPPGYPPGAYPPGTYPPGMQAWGQTAAPVAPTKRKPGVIIGAAVAGVAVIGGIFAAVNLTKDKEEGTAADGSEIISGPGPIDPDDGPAPTPPPPPATVPGPTTPPSVVTTTLPPSTTSTTEAPPPPPPPGDTQTVFGRIAVAIPQGWQVLDSAEGFAVLGTDGANYYVNAFPYDGDASALATDYMQQVNSGLQDISIIGQGDADLPSSSVVSAGVLSYEAVLATQQGSIPVEGVIIVWVTQDGIGVITETFNALGDFGRFGDDYILMRDSIISTL